MSLVYGPTSPPISNTVGGVACRCGPWDRIAWDGSTPGSPQAHLVGIGGSGMRSLAAVLGQRGWKLTGSDLAAALELDGVLVFRGHDAAQVPISADLVIASDAVPDGNPELVRAAALGTPVMRYFDAVGRLMRGRRGIAVAGTHGKSTTTAMAAGILVRAGLDPTVICGAVAQGSATGGRAGQSDLVLVEACEYRENFLKLSPRTAVVLGIERDHFDYYQSDRQLDAAFQRFVQAVPRDGLVLGRAACPRTKRVLRCAAAPVETFGLWPAADWSADRVESIRGRYRFLVLRRGQRVCAVRLAVPGMHNVLNALAAAAVAWHHGVAPPMIAAGLEGFSGLRRRLEPVGCWGGVTILDDYAHHPTEVAAALRTVRESYPNRRVSCVFQPHQASRTARLLDELAGSLHNADRVVVAEIFRAREPAPAVGEVTAADLAALLRARGTAAPPVHDSRAIVRHLETHLRPGDVLITMGAGDIDKVWHELVKRVREDRSAG